jgi:hypothetical protein
MTESLLEPDLLQNHPIDTIERLVAANEWSFERFGDDEMAVELAGRWCDYRMFFAWHQEAAAVHFSLALDMRVPLSKRNEVGALIALVNEKMWIGHFDLWSDNGLPMFRYAFLLRGTNGPSAEQVSELVTIALEEADRFYPAFQFVVWGGKSPVEAIACAMVDPVGEA